MRLCRAEEPNEYPVGLLSNVRRVAQQAQHQEKYRGISEDVDCLMARKGNTKSKLLTLCMTKEDDLQSYLFPCMRKKATQAISKNFVPFVQPKTIIKKRRPQICERQMNLLHLEKSHCNS